MSLSSAHEHCSKVKFLLLDYDKTKNSFSATIAEQGSQRGYSFSKNKRQTELIELSLYFPCKGATACLADRGGGRETSRQILNYGELPVNCQNNNRDGLTIK